MNRAAIRSLIFGLVLAGLPSIASAHNPLSARYHLEAGTAASVLTVNLSQDGVNQALLQAHDRQELEAMSRQSFEELIIAYIKDNFSLAVNDVAVTLRKGGIKLGDHQTDLKFVLPPFPDRIDEIDVRIPAFAENDQHQTIFSYLVDDNTGHVILRADNDFHATVALHPPEATIYHSLLVGFSGASLILGILVYWNRSSKLLYQDKI